MRTVWLLLAAYAVVYGATVLLTGDSTIMWAGLMVGVIVFGAATFVASRAAKVPAGRRGAGGHAA